MGKKTIWVKVNDPPHWLLCNLRLAQPLSSDESTSKDANAGKRRFGRFVEKKTTATNATIHVTGETANSRFVDSKICTMKIRKLGAGTPERRGLLATDVVMQNPLQPLDVNDDGRVSALDALLVIHALNDSRNLANSDNRSEMLFASPGTPCRSLRVN